MKQPIRKNLPPRTANKDIISRQKKENEASRRKLFGSITLLLVLTIVLVKLTSNIKPLAISPDVVEIQAINTESNLLKVTSSAIVTNQPTNSNSSEAINEKNDNPELILNDETLSQPTTTFKAGIVQKETSQIINSKPNKSESLIVAKAKESEKVKIITTENSKPITVTKELNQQPKIKEQNEVKVVRKTSNNPIDILNDSDDNDLLSAAIKNKTDKPTTKNDNNNNNSKAYIQLAALSSMEKAEQLKQKLSEQGISATVQTIQTDKGTLYRLKAGPYTNEVAKSKLQQLNNNGFNGIITSK